MTDRELADIICRALLAIVAGIRKKYNLPDRHNIVIILQELPKDVILPEPAQVAEIESKA